MVAPPLNYICSISLQVWTLFNNGNCSNYDVIIRLRHIPRPKMKICVLGDASHCDEAKAAGIPCMDAEALKKLNKDKKLVKKLGRFTVTDIVSLLLLYIAKKYDAFLASDSLIKQIPRLLGPGLSKAGKFPTLVTHSETLKNKVDEVKATIRFQMKKVSRHVVLEKC